MPKGIREQIKGLKQKIAQLSADGKPIPPKKVKALVKLEIRELARSERRPGGG